MIPASHLSASILLLKIITLIFPAIPFNFHTILLAMAFQMLPDLDIFWAKKLNTHHIGYFHSPILWIVIFLAISLFNLFYYIIPAWIVFLFIIQSLMHLFFDFVTGRTAGIPLFYPFSKKEFSLFPLNKNHGNFKPFSMKNEIEFFKYYFDGKYQVIFEAIILISGIILL